MNNQAASRCVALLLACGITATACAQLASPLAGQRVRLPWETVDNKSTHTYSPLSGLRVTVDTAWFPAGGYLPIDFLYESQQPSPAARELVIRVESIEAYGSKVVSQAVERATLAAGESRVQLRVLLPRAQQQASSVVWTTSVNEVADPAISSKVALSVTDPGLALRVLAPGRTRSTPRGFFAATYSLTDAMASRSETKAVFKGKRRLRCGPADRWLDYSASDVVAYSAEGLARLAEQSPDQLAALRRWVLAGGALWVEETRLEPPSLLAVDAALDASGWRYQSTPEEKGTDEEAEPDDDSEPPLQESSEPENKKEEAKSKSRSFQFDPIPGAPGWGFQRVDDQEVESVLKATGRRESSSRGWYAARRLGFGKVIAFNGAAWRAPARMRFGESQHYRESWLEEAWSKRHGLQPGRPSARFGNLLIPDVGLAPVGVFQLLVTLFVLVIGPLNYWLLWRRGQLQWLVLTVPIGAFLSTAGLLVYASLADGFGVKARARSVSLVNQRLGEMVSWSRVSHYAATQPDEPAILPHDTAIYPVSPAWGAAAEEASRRRETTWDKRGQVLTSGWLPHRNAVQHLLVRSGPTEAALAFTQVDGAGRVANRLGVPLELLLVHHEGGRWSRAAEIPAGETATLEEVVRFEAMKEFRLLTLADQPEFPVGTGKQIEQTLVRLGDRSVARRLQDTLSTVSLDDNLGEKMIGRLAGLREGRGLELPPRSYLAVTRQSVLTPLGWDGVQERGSFHLVVGRW